jgi:uncharacterized membrane protein YdjX (TVP38/TMEM64 family)
VFDFVSNEQQLQAWLDRLGPLGPLGVIGLNALQVVVAFIPGYAMMIAAGYLYGFPMGAVYGAIGMALGGVIAMFAGACATAGRWWCAWSVQAGWSAGKR